MSHAQRTLAFASVVVAILGSAGCASDGKSATPAADSSQQKADHPQADHPQGDHPKADHPKSDHPSGEHPE